MKLPQLSLRDLFWLVALVAVGCGWWVVGGGWWVERRAVLSHVKPVEQAAENRIRQAEGERAEAIVDRVKISNELWWLCEHQAGTTLTRP